MLRRFILIGLIAAAVATSSAWADPVALMPGVTSDRQVEFTPHGPVGFVVVTGPPTSAFANLYSIEPVLAGGTTRTTRERVTDITREVSASSTAVGINGDFSTGTDTHAAGVVVTSGAYQHAPSPGRSSIAFDANGGMHAGRISFAGTWKGSGQRRPVDGINQTPKGNQTMLFTSAWGAQTPTVANGVAVVFDSFPNPAPNTDLTATVTATGAAPTAIPSAGAVLLATGTDAAKLQAEAVQGSDVTVRLILPQSWGTIVAALGGGPLLVRGGKAVSHTSENFTADQLTARDARAAVGQLADGSVIFVAVDGGQPGYSVGMTTYELAQTMARLGAQTAVGLAFGKSVTAAFDGQLLSRPADKLGTPVKEGLLLMYFGVYAPPVTVPVIGTQNKSQAEELTYKIVRPSTVTASVISPDGVARPVDAGTRDSGIYHFTWNTYDQEGIWHWNVKATDDLGRASAADQTFRYDLTLSAIHVAKSARSPVKVAFALSRPASVTLRIETSNGVAVAITEAVSLDAGAQTLSWDGLTSSGGPAPAGSYIARVTAVSSIGSSDLSATFALRR